MQKTSSTNLKNLAEGASLGGVCTLERWVRQDGDATFFAGRAGNGGGLLIKLLPAQFPGAERQFATWERLRHLHHEHLLDLRDAGRCEVAGNDYLYGIFEYPDDVLATAVEHGALSEPETIAVLDAGLSALRYLHDNGLVHGAVDADHIVAVGETVKLGSDALGESEDPEARAEDLRQLGDLVRRLRAPAPLSESLAAMLRNAGAPDSVVTRAPVPELDTVEVHTYSPRAFPKWIFAGVAILLLSILLFNLRRKPQAPHVAVPTPAVNPAVAPQPVNQPAAAGLWRVIAFTYRSPDIAAKKAKQINSRWPDLRAAVFSPKALRGYYLVELGDAMRHDEATLLQRKARSLGLPRDTFVQNYSE